MDTCYRCGDAGHISRKCPHLGGGGGGGGHDVCFTCQQPGHIARNCTSGGLNRELQAQPRSPLVGSTETYPNCLHAGAETPTMMVKTEGAKSEANHKNNGASFNSNVTRQQN
ncbi:hypothetical protein F4780DRAFT_287003 [Xylariomycetidae sp. FL0641]|nr:hypothetical protein F4780DRAFT_287003 [Xylariomycetidae sp. FL0641]